MGATPRFTERQPVPERHRDTTGVTGWLVRATGALLVTVATFGFPASPAAAVPTTATAPPTTATAPPTTAAAPPAATRVAALPAWPLVKSGQQGPQVRTVQHLLRERGETITADGVFGALTMAAVQRFQTANGLTADGIVGGQTWPRLVVPLDSGATGEAVRALQVQLNRHRAGLSVTGTFDAATGTAVTGFKAAYGLSGGTAVDTTGWQWLVGTVPTVGGYALPIDHNVLPRSEYDDPHHDYPAIDLPVATGTPSYASAAGTVTAVNDTSCGIGAVVVDAANVRYIYCHFSSRVVGGGATVTAGQLIGYTGNTGNSTGPHLHYGIKTGTTNRCPQAFLLAVYDGVTPPNPATLPTTGCFYATLNPEPPLTYL